MHRTYDWQFPLPRTHTGVLLGNGTFGAMVWGEGRVLRITVGRADFWDHRGGMPWREGMSYVAIRALLEAGDEAGLRRLFEQTPSGPGEPASPSVLPIGRVELELPEGFTLTRATLDIDDGGLVVRAAGGGSEAALRLDVAIDRPVLCVQLPNQLAGSSVHSVPAWQYVGEYLRGISFQPPRDLASPELRGWLQERPADPALCLAYRHEGGCLWLAAEYGDSADAAEGAAARLLEQATAQAPEAIRESNAQWWQAFWEQTPHVVVPSPVLQFDYNYGMYKFATFTNSEGVPATVQGPWIEEYQMPPWSSDYHFNINVQMCYWPAYRGNQLQHLLPLFDMIDRWRPLLRQNARIFLGIEDGLMLPHAVDDRGTCMGGFWTGSVDHGCTAWVAKLYYDFWLYSADAHFLRDRAYPFMVGAMRVYEEMLEERGGGLVLPVGVSPEFRGSSLDAWGANASFQLACIHWLCEALIAASATLSIEPKPVWRDIRQRLPRAALFDGEHGSEMALWEGQPLRESHRHHSHLAGLYPFDVIDTSDPDWAAVVENSIATWVREGMGQWSGWSTPWAAILHSRLSNPDQAELALDIWKRVFTNEGHGTLHDVQFSGFSLMGKQATGSRATRPEIMQMDAGMGATAAVMELLLQTRRGINYLFAGAPAHWRDVSFERVRTEGAFLVSAKRSGNVVTDVTIESEAGGTFRLANPWAEGQVIELAMRPGETRTLRGPA